MVNFVLLWSIPFVVIVSAWLAAFLKERQKLNQELRNIASALSQIAEKIR